MKDGTKRLFTAVALLLAMLVVLPLTTAREAAANEIKYIVNGVPITTYDLQRRIAFLRLQQRGGNATQVAADELIDQVLHNQETKRLRITVLDQQVNDAYKNFASSNKLSVSQLDSILAQSGVTRDHFKDFIRAQMAWNQAVQARSRATGANTQDALRAMMKSGEQPTATEYVLQQVIFVVPERDRGRLLAKRRQEAQQIRNRYSGCESARELVKGMIDVTVRNLGRVLEPELPPDWADAVKAAKQGGATKVRDTQRGVEFIGICSTRVASDDRVAQLVFEQQQAEKGGSSLEELSKTYTKELRDKAQIVRR